MDHPADRREAGESGISFGNKIHSLPPSKAECAPSRRSPSRTRRHAAPVVEYGPPCTDSRADGILLIKEGTGARSYTMISAHSSPAGSPSCLRSPRARRPRHPHHAEGSREPPIRTASSLGSLGHIETLGLEPDCWDGSELAEAFARENGSSGSQTASKLESGTRTSFDECSIWSVPNTAESVETTHQLCNDSPGNHDGDTWNLSLDERDICSPSDWATRSSLMMPATPRPIPHLETLPPTPTPGVNSNPPASGEGGVYPTQDMLDNARSGQRRPRSSGGGSGNEQGDTAGPRGGKRRVPGPSPPGFKFACPYFKHTPEANSCCERFGGANNISYLK